MWWSSFLLLAFLNSLPHRCLASIGSAVRSQSNHVLRHQSILVVRGGQSQDPYSNTNYEENSAPNYEDGYANYGPPDPNDAEHLFQETVQERVDKWRSTQVERSQNVSEEQQANPRDEQGRMKLLASVGKGSRAFIFFVLMWRDIHLFELADQTMKGATRLMAVVPLTLLFIGNMAGVIASITSPGHSAKKRLKAILNLDKFVEVILLVWYFIRLTVAPSKYVPREIFISNTLHSIFFLIQCQAYTRVTWDQASVKPDMPQAQTYQQQPYSQDPGQAPIYAAQSQTPNQSYSDSPQNSDQYTGY